MVVSSSRGNNILSITHGHKDKFHIEKSIFFFIKYFKINLYCSRILHRMRHRLVYVKIILLDLFEHLKEYLNIFT